MTDRPELSLRELLEERRRMAAALQLIADAVDAMRDAPEIVLAIGATARGALSPGP